MDLLKFFLEKSKMKNTFNSYRIILLLLLIVLYGQPCSSSTRYDLKCIADTVRINYSRINLIESKVDRQISESLLSKDYKLKNRKGCLNIYGEPYSITENYPNYKNLGVNTGVLFGAGFVALGVLNMLPDGATAWNKGEILKTAFFKRWGNNVIAGPIWDDDNYVFNYILHPYAGAVYYMGARSQGFNLWYSALYTLGISTIFWEYGIEAFMEIPSLQDLIITPIAGTLIGECFYLVKRHIVSNDYKLWGSHFLGGLVAFIVDPINEVIGLVRGNPCRISPETGSGSDVEINCVPDINTIGGKLNVGVSLSLVF